MGLQEDFESVKHSLLYRIFLSIIGVAMSELIAERFVLTLSPIFSIHKS